MNESELVTALRETIRDIPDFPKEGILFRDITPVLRDGELFRAISNFFSDRYADRGVTQVVGIESRGFIFGAALAHALGVGLTLVRKDGKLPFDTHGAEYALEYGTDRIEIHIDALESGENVILIDDLLATGGTAEAAAALVEKCEATIEEIAFVIELDALEGRKRLASYDIKSLVHY